MYLFLFSCFFHWWRKQTLWRGRTVEYCHPQTRSNCMQILSVSSQRTFYNIWKRCALMNLSTDSGGWKHDAPERQRWIIIVWKENVFRCQTFTSSPHFKHVKQSTRWLHAALHVSLNSGVFKHEEGHRLWLLNVSVCNVNHTRWTEKSRPSVCPRIFHVSVTWVRTSV